MSNNSGVTDNSYELSGAEPVPGTDLFAVLWRARWRILSLILILGLAYSGYALLRISTDHVRRSASQEIVFTFDGASRGQYANGLAFSPQDLLAEPVLKSVYERLQLADFMKPAELAAALSISDASGVEAQAIQASFTQRLQNSKLTEPERLKIEKEFREAMDRLRGQQYLIVADFGQRQLPAAVVSRVLASLPDRWAQYARETRGMAAYDLSAPRIVAWDDSASLWDQWALLEEESESLERYLEKAERLPGASSARTGDGVGLAEIRRDASVLRRTQIEPAAEMVFRAAGSDGLRRLKANLEASEVRFELARAAADAARESFSQYVTMGRGEMGRNGGGESGTSASAATTINVPEGLIAQLVDLRASAGDLPYRQRLNENFIKAKEQMLLADSRRSVDRVRFERLQRGSGESDGPSMDPVKVASGIKKRLATLSQQASTLVSTLSERNLNPSSVLYRLEGPVMISEQGTVSLRQLGLGLAGTLLAAAAAGVAWSLIPLRRDGEPQSSSQPDATLRLPVRRTAAGA